MTSKISVMKLRSHLTVVAIFIFLCLIFEQNLMSVTYSVPELKKAWLSPNISGLGQAINRESGMGLSNEWRVVDRLIDTVFFCNLEKAGSDDYFAAPHAKLG